MKNDDFLAMCKSINPSSEVDKAKNLEAIKLKLEEQNTMKNKRIKRPLAVAAIFAAVMAFSLAVYAVAPVISGWVLDMSRFNVHNIVDTERDVSFTMGLTPYGIRHDLADVAIEGYNISIEEASKIAAAAIYDRFGFCIDGMEGFIHFIDNSANGFIFWSGFIVSYELTTHTPNSNELFYFTICALTGEIFDLTMNTPDTPFRG